MIEGRMAKCPKTVNDFLRDLRTGLAPGGRKELAKLRKLKKRDLKTRSVNDSSSNKYFMWDHLYYNRIMLEKDFSLDQQLISEYFPLQTTIKGTLKIFGELFG